MMKKLVSIGTVVVLCVASAIADPAATNTTYKSANGQPAAGRVQYWEEVVNFATENVAANTAIQLFNLPPTNTILAAGVAVATAGSGTAAFGTRGASNLFAQIDLSSAGYTGGTTSVFPYYTTSSTNIELLVGSANAAGKVRLWALTVDARKPVDE